MRHGVVEKKQSGVGDKGWIGKRMCCLGRVCGIIELDKLELVEEIVKCLMEKNRMNILLDLFLTFAKIGLFTFGGGYAMISMIENNCVERKKWITHDEMMNVTVIAESTPGPIAINCATFTGYKKAGFLGALVATLGMIVPSFIVIFLISMFLDNFLELTLIANAFKGIKIAVGLLILDSAITMIRKMHKKKFSRVIMVCSCVTMLCINIFAWNFSSISLMIVAAVVSLSFCVCNSAPAQKGGAKK